MTDADRQTETDVKLLGSPVMGEEVRTGIQATTRNSEKGKVITS
jgi:hypothetical protein